MTNVADTKLMTCPFCGEAPSETGNNLIGIVIACRTPNCAPEPLVSARNRADAYRAWNTRVPDPLQDPTHDEIQRLGCAHGYASAENLHRLLAAFVQSRRHRFASTPDPRLAAAQSLADALAQSQWGLIEVDDETHVEGCKRRHRTALEGHDDSCPTGAALAAWEKLK